MASLELCRSSVKAYMLDVINFEIKTRLTPLLSSFVDRKTGILDLQDVFRRFAFDCICKISFGLDPKCLELCLPMSEFAVSFDLASRLSAERAMTTVPLIWKLKRFFNIGSERKLKKAINMINVLAQGLIQQRRKKDFSNDPDLLSKFMNSSITDDETLLRDIVISFVLAGRDTVASALTSLFWVLANHPFVSEAIRDEADRVIGTNQEMSSIEQLQKLHYLQAVVYEVVLSHSNATILTGSHSHIQRRITGINS
ncbi:hypothetical protein ACET3Z_023352 [Daucus carota]